MHAWASELFCDLSFIENIEDRREFMRGAQFPDIRYIAHFPRHLTHPNITDLKQVYEGSSYFDMGLRFHSWLDHVREEMIPGEVYDQVALYSKGHSATLLKFVEDEILATSYDASPWVDGFGEVCVSELKFAEESAIANWHIMISWTFLLRPSDLLWMQSYKGPLFGVSSDVLYDWSYYLPYLKEHPLFKAHTESLRFYIEEMLWDQAKDLSEGGL